MIHKVGTLLLPFLLLLNVVILNNCDDTFPIRSALPQSFSRKSIEQIPTFPSSSQYTNFNYSSIHDYSLDSELLAPLPIRSSVEKVLTVRERAEERLPLREAVEKIPISNEALENLKAQRIYKQQPVEEKSYKVVCYVSNWAWYRKSEPKFTPDYVDSSLCTHLVYAFASVSSDNYTIISSDPVTDYDNGFYKKIIASANSRSNKTKVLIAIGGWTDSAGDKYSKLVGSGSNRRRFINSVVAFLRRHNFQGIHLDWNYPVCWQARCSEAHLSDRTNFVKLIQELRTEFNKHNPKYELAIAVSGYKEIIDVGYDILNINEYVDFMSIMTYDYHGPWENQTGHLSPLYTPTPPESTQFPEYNTDSTLSSLVLLGAEPRKLVMGVPFFGQSFTLANAEEHDFGAATIDAGYPGEYTQQPGILAYSEICIKIKREGWKTGRNTETGTESYAYKGNQWVGFDDKRTLRKKINYLKESGYGGIMAWTLDLDDFNNDCCTGIYPLLREVNVALGRIVPDSWSLQVSAAESGDCTKPTTPTPIGTETVPPTTTDWDNEGATSATTSSIWTTSTIHYPTTSSTEKPTTTTTTEWTWTTSGSTAFTVPSSATTRPWWPPTLTTRPTVSHRPPSTLPPHHHTTVTVTSTTKRKKPTKFTTITRPPSTTTSTSTEYTPDTGPEETTPHHHGHQCVSGNYYPDPSDCSSYFRCVYDRKKKERCGPGLHWSTRTESCDWPSKANCHEHAATGSSPSSSYGSTEPTFTSRPSPVPTTPASTNRPIVSCTHGEHYSVPGDCSSFYTCDGGRLQKRKCPTGLVWNKQKRLCDWTYNVQCSNDLNTATTGVESTGDAGLRKDTLKSDNTCNFGQYARHLDDCNKYYECLWGVYRETHCPPGLFWNKKMLICDWPENVDCEPHEGNEIDVPFPGHTSKLPPSSSGYPRPTTSKPTIDEWANPSTSPSTTSTTSKNPWGTWTEPSTTTKPTSTSAWWTWTEPTWSWSEKPSTSWSEKPSTSWSEKPTTSWEWKPTTTTATTLATPAPVYPLSGQYKVICYFTNWAWYRTGVGKYLPENVDPNLCTHVIYGFAVLDFESLVIKIFDSWADIDNGFYERVAALKKRGLKVSVAIGGWNDSAGDKYSRLVNSASARRAFVSSVLRFLKQYGFDGLDLDWEYPKCWQVNCDRGPDSDKAGFAALVTELRQAFNPHGYLLSAAVSPSKMVIDKGYDVVTLSENLDWIGVMTYDYHGSWDKKTGHLAPIYHIPGDDYDYFNLNFSINYWIEKGADRQKVIMGIPLYGQTFTLADTSKHGLNAPSYGPGQAGEYTRAGGFLAYYEICDKMRKEPYTIVHDAERRRGPYAHSGNQWVGFDDVPTIKQKVKLIKEYGIGGGMIWALDLDDFRNVCGQGHYPLLNAIAEGLAASEEEFIVTEEASSSWSEVTRPQYPHTSRRTTTTTTTETPSPVPSSTPEPTTPEEEYTSPSSTSSSSTYGSSAFTEETTPSVTENIVPSRFTTPSVSGTTSSPDEYGPKDDFKVVCYFTNWAWYRQGNGKYMINDIDANLCTHIIYAFAVLDSNKLVIKPHDAWADLDNKFYERVVALKSKGIKVLLAIGGWNDSAGNKYSRLVNSKQSRDKFIVHVVQFLKKYNFDGLDVDWEYPKCWQVNCKLGPASDKKAFSDFITELREAFDEHGFLLSAAVSPNRKVIDEGYDVPLLNNKLDWISVMAYDYHGQWDEVTGHVAPMYIHPDDSDKTFNANYSIHYWVDKGAERKKIVMGMPMYGQSFTLASPKNNTLNSKAYGGGEAGECTKARGFLAYYEICERILRKGWETEYDVEGRMGPYAKRGNQWVSFDDQAMIKHKSQYVYYNNLGGAMIWALDLDDFRGVCNCGSYPLLKTINKVLRNHAVEKENIPDCYLESSTKLDTKLFYQNEGIELLGEEWRLESCEHGEVKKHPTDCSKYLICSFGRYQREQSCATGLHFNEKRNMCDWPENAQCKQSIMDVAEAYFLNNLQKQASSTSLASKKDSTAKYKVVCYLTNWSAYRYNNQLFPLQAIDSHMCTHLVYSFVILDPQTLTIKSNSTFIRLDNEFFKRVRVLKETGVKVSVALGGWFDSNDDKYSRLVSSRPSRSRFIKHAVKFLKEYEFDGLEIDWEFPKCWQVDCTKGPDSDKSGFTVLLKELREAFDKHGLLLSAAVSPSREVIDKAYEVANISSYVNWLSVMAYDYHGYWEGKTNHIAPLFEEPNETPVSSLSSDYSSVESSIMYWIERGAAPNKLILGLPLYGQSFTLNNSTNHKIGSKVIAPGKPGRHTRVPGFVSFYEICELRRQENWKVVKEKNLGHYIYAENQWISYNDISDIKAKGKYVKENNLGGAAIWSLDLDDFVNMCGCGANPLLAAANEELSVSYRSPQSEQNKDCVV